MLLWRHFKTFLYTILLYFLIVIFWILRAININIGTYDQLVGTSFCMLPIGSFTLILQSHLMALDEWNNRFEELVGEGPNRPTPF